MIAQNRKKGYLLLGIMIVGALMIQSFNIQQQQPKKLKNIKVFPATATYQEVDHAMDQYKVDLGVKCNYCHAPDKENPRKNDMRMTNEMNAKYIATLKHTDQDTSKIQLITCNTCHRGVPKPFGKPVVATPPPPQAAKPLAYNRK